MPIHTSFKKMLRSMGNTYKKGPTKCRKLVDGSEVCISQQAWSVFFAWINEHKKDETKGLSMVDSDAVVVITPKIYASAKNTRKRQKIKQTKLSIEGMTDEELIYYHALAHSEFNEIGDDACKDHFKIANEMLNRGLEHVERTQCDAVISLSKYGIDSIGETDNKKMLLSKWKACKGMLFRLSQGVPFESGVFKGLSLEEQKHMIKNFMRKLKRSMLACGMKPKKKIKPK